MKNSRSWLHPAAFGAALLFLSLPTAMAEQSARLVRSEEAGWPQFRGPARDGVSLETGLLKTWPEEGPKLLWHVTDLGDSYSSPIITEQGIFITGDVVDDLVISAYDLEGALRWKKKNGNAWKDSYPGGGQVARMTAAGCFT